MRPKEALNEGLSIVQGVGDYIPPPKYQFRQWVEANDLARQTGIHVTTIKEWARTGKIRSERCTCSKHILIYLADFTEYVLKHYRHRRMNSRAGKQWQKDELANPIERTPMAIKIKHHRLKKVHNI